MDFTSAQEAMMADLGMLTRDFIVTDDAPRSKEERLDRRIPLSRLNMRRLVNQEGTLENQQANEKRNEVGAWNTTSQNLSRSQGENEARPAMQGQTHRARLERNQHGNKLTTEAGGRFSGPGDARLNAVRPPPSLVGANVTSRAPLRAAQPPLPAGSSSQPRPLDPAVDTTREYFLKSKSKGGRRVKNSHNPNTHSSSNQGNLSQVMRPYAQTTRAVGRESTSQNGHGIPTIDASGQVTVGRPPSQRAPDAAPQNSLTSASAAAFSQAVKRPPEGFLAHIPPGPRPAPNSKAAAVIAKAKAPTPNVPRKILEPKAPSLGTTKNGTNSNEQASINRTDNRSAELSKASGGRDVVKDLRIPPEKSEIEDAPGRIKVHGRWYVLDTMQENPQKQSSENTSTLKDVTTSKIPSVDSVSIHPFSGGRIQVSENISISTKSLIGDHLLPVGTNTAARSKGAESLASSKWASSRKSFHLPSMNDSGLTPQKTLQLARLEPPRPPPADHKSPHTSVTIPNFATAMDMESRSGPSHLSGGDDRSSSSESFENPFQIPSTACSLVHVPQMQTTGPSFGIGTSSLSHDRPLELLSVKSYSGTSSVKPLQVENEPMQTKPLPSLPTSSALEASKWAPSANAPRKSNVGRSISGNVARNNAKKAPVDSILGDSKWATKPASKSGLKASMWAK